MKVEIIANGTMSFALIPENEFEEIAIKMIVKQNNEFIEVTSQTQILNKVQFSKGLVIQPKARENIVPKAIEHGAAQEMGFEDRGPGKGAQIGGSRLED